MSPPAARSRIGIEFTSSPLCFLNLTSFIRRGDAVPQGPSESDETAGGTYPKVMSSFPSRARRELSGRLSSHKVATLPSSAHRRIRSLYLHKKVCNPQ
ncbi:hypothetical protein PGT21_035955 [Puccinia graminis f. sp. tritici]|uniref:Uncharacterized protein n=1 Tax=Puccinia graminis f. sp. tritici TaxID=56615 RepID=A0A5B0RBB9_PUCGR|nr:hypothetical protein PGT21_035955 [Puccinia graminis f. sp. tritici]KAA1123026.1 hypothetical protein PGTUg99_008507 [Puccinia graminis f. sp. tritici]